MRKRRTTRPGLRLLRLGLAAVAAGAGLWLVWLVGDPAAAVGDLLAILSSVSGVLLGFYLTFTGSWGVLTPLLILTYLLLWVVPVLPLVWTVDKL